MEGGSGTIAAIEAAEKERTGDIFHDTHPYTNWRVGVEHAAKMGVGSLEYELIEV